jgi:hypothetical protein
VNEPPQPSRKTLEILGMMALAEISKVEEKAFGGRKSKSTFDLDALCEFNDWEEQVEQWKLGIEQLRGNALAERVK